MDLSQSRHRLILICLFSCITTLYAATQPCDHCSCHLTAYRGTTSTLRQSILLLNCSNTIVSNILRPPLTDSYQQLSYTEIHAEFKYNKIGKIDKFDVKRLTKLSLANNEIRHIEDGAFSKLSMLRDLDLSVNKLNKAELNGKTFQNLKSLERLNLYDTGISNLDKTVFAGLVSLRVLNLGHNFLVEDLDPVLFSSLSKLEDLSIKENALTQIHSETFKDLYDLKYLDLSGNSLGALTEDVFVSLAQLTYLDLSNNKLATIPESTFKNLDKLIGLNLATNEISGFDANFAVPRTLRVFRVGDNRLQDVDFLTKTSFEDLQEVHVENNLLSRLDFIQPLAQMQVLNVSSNRITEAPKQIFPKLRILDLSNNSLPSLPKMLTAQYLPALRSLSLDMNPLTELEFPASDIPFLYLSYVTLSHMQELKEVKATAFSALTSKPMSKSGRFELAGDLESGIVKREATSVEMFDDFEDDYMDDEAAEGIGGGHEEKATETEEETKGDKGIEDKGNDPMGDGKISEEVKEDYEDDGSVPEVKEVDAKIVDNVEEDDDVKELKDDLKFPELESNEGDYPEPEQGGHLQVANYRSAPVGDLNDEVEGTGGDPRRGAKGKMAVRCTSPLVLRVSHNKNLVAIEEGAFLGVDICELDLSYNSLNNIPEKMVDWTAVPSIDLQGNPWDCSCRLQWLLETIVPKMYVNKPELLYELRCGSPPLLRDRRFVHFYNWSEPAFCTQHKDRMREAPAQDTPSDGSDDVMLRLGGSGGMLIVVGVACGVVCLLVGVGVWLQRRQTMQRRARNRRV